jgi:tetratricopeptide (TPR) repeat protein
MTRTIITISLLLNILFLTGQNVEHPLIVEGNSLILHNKYHEAIDKYTTFIDRNPKKAIGYTKRAYARNLIGRHEDALKDIFEALSIDSRNAETYYVHGLIQARMENFEKALVELNTALDIKPNYKYAIAGKIYVYYKMEDYREAYSLVKDAIDTYPNFGNLYFYRGQIFTERNKFDKAVIDFTQALSKPHNVENYKIYIGRGNAYLRMENLTEAAADFRKSISMFKNSAPAYHGRGVINYRLGRFSEAVEDFQESIMIIHQSPEMFEENPESYYNLAMCFLKMEELEKACKNFHLGCDLGNQNSCKMVILRCMR